MRDVMPFLERGNEKGNQNEKCDALFRVRKQKRAPE